MRHFLFSCRHALAQVSGDHWFVICVSVSCFIGKLKRYSVIVEGSGWFGCGFRKYVIFNNAFLPFLESDSYSLDVGVDEKFDIPCGVSILYYEAEYMQVDNGVAILRLPVS